MPEAMTAWIMHPIIRTLTTSLCLLSLINFAPREDLRVALNVTNHFCHSWHLSVPELLFFLQKRLCFLIKLLHFFYFLSSFKHSTDHYTCSISPFLREIFELPPVKRRMRIMKKSPSFYIGRILFGLK